MKNKRKPPLSYKKLPNDIIEDQYPTTACMHNTACKNFGYSARRSQVWLVYNIIDYIMSSLPHLISNKATHICLISAAITQCDRRIPGHC